jgi:dipeptidyl aminopeptidase/acylaminoacyl peptidase
MSNELTRVQSDGMAIPVERCIVTRDLTEPALAPDGRSLVYAMTAGGSAALHIDLLDGSPTRQLTSYPPPRPGRGFGGGCWCWTPDGGAVIYAAIDGELWLQPVPNGSVRRLTHLGPERAAVAPAAVTDGGRVVYVVDESELWTTQLDDGSARRLDDGSADFVFDPCPTADGNGVAWQSWNFPDMPWDSSRVERINFDGSGAEAWQPAGAVQQPRFLSDGTPICVCDEGGWLNVWLDGQPLLDEPFEHGGPAWGMGQRSFAVSPNGRRVAFTRNEGGFGRLCVVDVGSRLVTEVARGVHGQLSWQGGRLCALRSGARTPTQIVVYDDTTWQRTVVAVGPLSGWEALPLAEPDLVEVTAADGTDLFARLYRADAPTGHLLCWLHGGPTDQWQVTFMPRIAYWRAQGWNVLVPDHRGSTGHGRAYQQALRGRWGELDVSDIADVLAAAHARNWGSPAQTAVVGSSAGGFTAIGVAASHPRLVAALVVAYPVTDLGETVERGHRFEQHYTDSLVGQMPGAAAIRSSRSPLNYPERLTHTPILLMHGDSDPVVPLQQSRAFVERCRAAGVDIDFVVYEGEGHGFRKVDNQFDEYRRMHDFLASRILGG